MPSFKTPHATASDMHNLVCSCILQLLFEYVVCQFRNVYAYTEHSPLFKHQFQLLLSSPYRMRSMKLNKTIVQQDNQMIGGPRKPYALLNKNLNLNGKQILFKSYIIGMEYKPRYWD